MREIYLRNFEICVKEAKPISIMTSYNKVNGVWSHYNYDLVTTVLRREWGISGHGHDRLVDAEIQEPGISAA